MWTNLVLMAQFIDYFNILSLAVRFQNPCHIITKSIFVNCSIAWKARAVCARSYETSMRHTFFSKRDQQTSEALHRECQNNPEFCQLVYETYNPGKVHQMGAKLWNRYEAETKIFTVSMICLFITHEGFTL